MEREIIHEVRVKNLIGASHKGRYFELKIDYIGENEEFNCPTECSRSSRTFGCDLKNALMEKPEKSRLICTVVIIIVRNISRRPLFFSTDSKFCKAIDSQGNLYQTQREFVPDLCKMMFRQKFGMFFDEGTEIPSGTSARFLLHFPPIPKGSKIAGLFIKYENDEFLEVFDFRLDKNPARRGNLGEAS